MREFNIDDNLVVGNLLQEFLVSQSLWYNHLKANEIVPQNMEITD